MIALSTAVTVDGVSAAQICDFMINCNDARYHTWWPEAHFRFHTTVRKPGHIGSLVYFDEMVGRRRLRFQAVVTEFIAGKRIVWQMKLGCKLPAWLTLEFDETPGALLIIHTLSAGFKGPGRPIDLLLRLYLTRRFEADLSGHARTEFKKLAWLLQGKT